MKISNMIEKLFIFSVDLFYSLVPRPVPAMEKLKKSKIVAHRGDHFQANLIENTIPAFNRALENNVWGFEFDIRWTKDLQPVVFHDADLLRIFGSSKKIKDLTLDHIKQSFPLIPTLKEVIEKYGKKMHIMAEIKEEEYPDPEFQNGVLKDIFSSIEPAADYHVLSLAPSMFSIINFAPENSFVAVAETNLRELSELSLSRHFGGVCGHYVFMKNGLLKKHHEQGQMAGTGHSSSGNVLFREINRGVDWIFSNRAVAMQKIVEKYLH
jgi:glycerophosphoryl diester phosphodiesterase